MTEERSRCAIGKAVRAALESPLFGDGIDSPCEISKKLIVCNIVEPHEVALGTLTGNLRQSSGWKHNGRFGPLSRWTKTSPVQQPFPVPSNEDEPRLSFVQRLEVIELSQQRMLRMLDALCVAWKVDVV